MVAVDFTLYTKGKKGNIHKEKQYRPQIHAQKKAKNITNKTEIRRIIT
jgi:hypothetical protein